jgi:hypothetical protein
MNLASLTTKDKCILLLMPPAGKKGVSYEEKRKRTMDFLMEKRDFFMLRELEKLLPKEKGIVSQSVKDIVQSLVDDRLINCEKVGPSNYIFSFPSTALKCRTAKRDSLEAELLKLKALEEDLVRQEGDALVGREDGPERFDLVTRLTQLEGSTAEMRKELDQFREMDPDLYEERRKLLDSAKEACIRWTDNIFTLQSHCSKVFGVSSADFNSSFEIPNDLDYI